MENQNHPENQHDSSWIDELLPPPEVGEEIGPDESAVYAACLTHPADAELERIINEAKAMEVTMEEEDLLGEVPADSFSSPEDPTPEQNAEDPFQEDFLSEETPAEEFLPDEPTAIFTEDMMQAYADAYPPEEPQDEPEDPQPEPEPPVRKIRPRRKKGYGLLGIPHILATVVWLAITVAIGVSLGRMIWVCAADVLAFGRTESTAIITITDGDNIETIAAKLKNAGLIKYPGLFELYASVAVDEGEIAKGTYTLSSLYDYHALVKSMNQYSSFRETVEVVIPEGYTCAQTFRLLEEKGVCTVAELEEYAANGKLKDYWFLEGVERGDRYCLEGYLFPDTYEFYVDDSPGRVLGKMLGDSVGGFDVRFTDIMEEKLVTLNERLAAKYKKNGYGQDYIDEHKITIREVVIIASMIEKESTGADAYDIGSVIYNRLTNAKSYPFLNIDATLLYALEGNIDPETGKPKPLTQEDLRMDHPYNTYTQKGLIPGPIANPGTASLLAALDPNDTNYYYYVYDYDAGIHLFAKNQKEHEKNVAKVNADD